MDGHNITIFGRKGYGKSTWIKWYIIEHPDKYYFIYDHFEEFESNMYFVSIQDFIEKYNENLIKNKNIFVFRGEIEYDDFFHLCCEVKNCVAVFDEIDMACAPGNIEPNLYRIIHYGRHLNVGLISASRRPANVSRNLTSQADEIICYNIQEPRDLKYIEDFCGKEIAGNVNRLKRFQFIRYPQKTGEKG